jgi:hypothetical protein
MLLTALLVTIETLGGTGRLATTNRKGYWQVEPSSLFLSSSVDVSYPDYGFYSIRQHQGINTANWFLFAYTAAFTSGNARDFSLSPLPKRMWA